ncbi:hypothetical protein [Thermococcus sp. 21S7]|uniref:hypothetical protein n=1 Tax=Thermococcus sp. 21S7 TaxID=1638221 RepID=UPI001439BB8F|nr:hypothetical protein [Thermococcus sp. 21S7]NJE61972.1 hypothetical protein [Thermococcus sp. 21S7]
MRRSNKKRLIPLVFALVLTMVGAALAVPTISVNLQNLGAGDKTFSPSLDVNAHVNFKLGADGTDVTGVMVYLTGNDVETGATVYVHLIDTNGNDLASEGGTVQQDASGNYYVDISFNPGVSIDQLNGVKVIYKGKEIKS